MSKKTEDWNDIVEDTDNIDKSGTNNPNKNDDIVSTTTTSKPSRSVKTDKPDKSDKPNKPDIKACTRTLRDFRISPK